jgi:hypothetical protein
MGQSRDLHAIGMELIRRCGVEKWKLEGDTLEGSALPAKRRIWGPAPNTIGALCVVAHECAHVALRHNNRRLTVHRGEFEAEQFAVLVLRHFVVSIPHSLVAGGRDYVAETLETDIQVRRLRRVDAETFHWVLPCLSRKTIEEVRTGAVTLAASIEQRKQFESLLRQYLTMEKEVIGGREVVTRGFTIQRWNQ